MSSSINRDLVYCLRILESIAKIELYVNRFSNADELYHFNEQINFNATLNLLAHIGENIKKISKELKKKYPDISWRLISNFRNKIIHEYTGIDFTLTFFIIKNKLPELKNQIIEIVIAGLKNKSFDYEDLKSAVGSEFYKDIDFSIFNMKVSQSQ